MNHCPHKNKVFSTIESIHNRIVGVIICEDCSAEADYCLVPEDVDVAGWREYDDETVFHGLPE